MSKKLVFMLSLALTMLLSNIWGLSSIAKWGSGSNAVHSWRTFSCCVALADDDQGEDDQGEDEDGVSVPEASVFAYLGAGLAAIGSYAFIKRRGGKRRK